MYKHRFQYLLWNCNDISFLYNLSILDQSLAYRYLKIGSIYIVLMSYRWIATGMEHICCCVRSGGGWNTVGKSSFWGRGCVKCHPQYGASGCVHVFSKPYILVVGCACRLCTRSLSVGVVRRPVWAFGGLEWQGAAGCVPRGSVGESV